MHTSLLIDLLCLIRLTPLAMELSSDVSKISNQGGPKKSASLSKGGQIYCAPSPSGYVTGIERFKHLDFSFDIHR